MNGKAGAALLLCLMASTTGAYELQPPHEIDTGSWADSVAIGDVDGDGRDDVVLSTTFYFDDENDRKIFVFLQKPDGSLANPVKIPYSSTEHSTALVLANLDGDKAKEIILGHAAGIEFLKWNKVARLRQSRTYPTTYPVLNTVAFDIDRDGHLDVVASTGSGANINLGDGKGGVRKRIDFQTPAQGNNDIKSGDINGDGWEDLIIYSGPPSLGAWIYYNDGTEDLSPPVMVNFTPLQAAYPATFAIGDFNGDARNDLVLTRNWTELSLLNQKTDGTLDGESILTTKDDPEAMLGSDMDGDGETDLVIGRGGSASIYFQESGVLGPETFYSGLYGNTLNKQGIAVGDINDDGCKDIAIAADFTSHLVIYLGSGCVQKADLVPSLGLTKNFVTLRVDNAGNAAANDTHAALMLSISSGSLALGTLPAGCSLVTQSTRAAQLDCSYGSMAVAANDTRTLSFQVTGGDLRNAVVAKAGVSTTSAESKTNNNSASKRLMLAF